MGMRTGVETGLTLAFALDGSADAGSHRPYDDPAGRMPGLTGAKNWQRTGRTDLNNSATPDSSSLRRFNAGSGAMQVNVITAASPTQRFHLEESGTCSLQPPAAPL